MLLCRVEGSATSTIHHRSLRGWRLLLCQPVNERDEKEGSLLLALDRLGAGLHQKVIVTSDGKSIRQIVQDENSPLRFMTVGVVDDTRDPPCA